MKMKILRITGTLLISFLIVSCGANTEKKKMKAEIDELEATLFGDTTGMPDRTLALQTIQAYENFANTCPEDTLSPEYLYKGAEIAMNLQMSGKAIEMYNRIRNNYPEYNKVSYCMFLQAFIYENQMGQLETAKGLYQQFIDQFPDHQLADDAQVSLENMGKSIEDLIKAWETREQNE